MPARYDTIIVVRKKNAKGEWSSTTPSVGRARASGARASRTRPEPRATRPPTRRRPACGPYRAARDGPRLAYGRRPARRLRALPRVLRSRPAHPVRLSEGVGGRAGQVRHRAARHHQQRRAQGQCPRLDRGALGRQGRGQASRPVQVLAQLGDRPPPRAGAGQLPARHPALLRGRRSRRDHLGGRRGRPFLQRAPELHADAVRLARETGLRIGDLVELERSEIKKAPDGSRAIILRPNKRRRRIVNMPLTPAAEAIIDKAPISRRLILKPKRADAWDSGPALARGPRVRHRVRDPPGAPVQRPARDEGDRDGVVGDQRA